MLDKLPQRKSLSDILQTDNDRERLSQLWKTTTAAEERGPLPPGEYTFRILTGELSNAKHRGTPGYKLTLEVAAGEHEGRRAWHDLWLTLASLPMTKRDLAKIGVTDLDQPERPLPAGILIRGKLTLGATTTATKSTSWCASSASAPNRAMPSSRRTTTRARLRHPRNFPFGAPAAPIGDANQEAGAKGARQPTASANRLRGRKAPLQTEAFQAKS